MAYIHGTSTKIAVYIYNAQYPKIIESGAHCSIIGREYLDKHFPHWEKQLLPINANNFESSLGKMTTIGTIIQEIIIPHRKRNIRLNPEFVVLEDAHLQDFYWEQTTKQFIALICTKVEIGILKNYLIN
ncbi:hypothetical protein O181_005492 [Austropuccinia psidii MF-1]|uniref:Uncharacterized protein n=1 Tax=Austropuccinia psidii MF-1 TaxID=1389203 RepID=A0A9Q3GGQ5_9BASI|nr:hypothetical protein [Austropuccinia psidii MF-1]